MDDKNFIWMGGRLLCRDLGGVLACGCLLAVLIAPVAWSQGQPLAKVRANTGGVTGEGGFFLALEKGYFRNEALDIQIIPAASTNSGMDTVAQLASGELDVAALAPGAGLFNALARKIGITGVLALNAITATDQSIGVIVRNDLIASGRYKSLPDLKGLKIAVLTRGGNGHYVVQKAAEKGGLKGADLDLTTMSFPDAIVALSSKAIEAAFEPEPFISIAESRKIAQRVVSGSDVTVGTPTIMLFVNNRFLAQNRDVVVRFTAALLLGQRDYYAAVAQNKNVEDLYAALKKYTQLKDEGLLRTIKLPTVDPNGKLDMAAVADLQSFFKETGNLQRVLEPAEIIDASLVDDALKRIGPYN